MGTRLVAIDGFVPDESAQDTVEQLQEMLQGEVSQFACRMRTVAVSVDGGKRDKPEGSEAIMVNFSAPEDQVDRLIGAVSAVVKGASGQILQTDSFEDPLDGTTPHPSSSDTRKCGTTKTVRRPPAYMRGEEYGGVASVAT